VRQRGNILPRASEQTSLWSLGTRAFGQPIKEAKQMTAATTRQGPVPANRTTGAASPTPEHWHDTDWYRAHRNVRRLQARIVQATQQGRWGKVQALQHLLTHSHSGKLLAVKRVTENQGKHTPGVDGRVWNTPEAKMAAVHALRQRGYQPRPLRRVSIPKTSGGRRPLSIPTVADRAMQALYLLALDPVAEATADPHSYGFRRERSTADAMARCFRVLSKRRAPEWILEGDLKACFDNIDHAVLLRILGENIHDNRFLELLRRLLQAGYLEDWRSGATLSGTPQGGVLSPLLANIYLNELDRFVEQQLLPAYTRGDRRRDHPQYATIALRARRWRRRGRMEEARMAAQAMRQLPSQDPADPHYRRLRYVRYADDWLLGFAGPKAEAEEIKGRLREFLRDHLNLALSDAKTLITHAGDKAARFLGYAISGMHADTKLDRRGRRSVNGHIMLKAPWDVIVSLCSRYEGHGKPEVRPSMLDDEDFSIVGRYGAELRGYVNYYALAHNVGKLYRLKWTMETSMLKTLANKHKSTVTRMARKYRTKLVTPDGTFTCFQVVVERNEGKRPLNARFGGFAIRRRTDAVLVDQRPPAAYTKGTELLKRLQADACERCGSTIRVEVHHIRKLADLKRHGRKELPNWQRLMAARKRKTLVTCRNCHEAIHAGRPLRQHVSE
jgi:group II intron reverse transcriptase/maturase